jgi:hypothetical protein
MNESMNKETNKEQRQELYTWYVICIPRHDSILYHFVPLSGLYVRYIELSFPSTLSEVVCCCGFSCPWQTYLNDIYLNSNLSFYMQYDINSISISTDCVQI